MYCHLEQISEFILPTNQNSIKVLSNNTSVNLQNNSFSLVFLQF